MTGYSEISVMPLATPVCHTVVTHTRANLQTGWTRDIQQGLTWLLQFLLGHGSLMPASLLPFSCGASKTGRAKWDPCVFPAVTHNWLRCSVIFCEPFSNADPPALTRGIQHPRDPNLGLANPGPRQRGEPSIAQRPAGS